MSYDVNFAMLELALDVLGELADELVFVGGATTCLYVDTDIADEIRPTEDVDCVVEAYSRKEYNRIEDKIRKRGFQNDVRTRAPLCRYVYKGVLTLDLMPDDASVLGFSNSWYRPGIKNKVVKKIKDKPINIFSLPYFLASKLEAFHNRGMSDPRLSSDLEDIIIVLDGIKDFSLPPLDIQLKKYLSKMGSTILKDANIQEAINGFLVSEEKIQRTLKRVNILVA